MLAKVQKKLQRTEGDVQSNHTVVHYTSNDAKKHIIHINLFYLSYILHSMYGADSRTPGNTIEFLRLKPMEVEQGETVMSAPFNDITIREYSTNNPQLLR